MDTFILLFNIFIYALILYWIVSKFIKRSASKNTEPQPSPTPKSLNLDNNYFLIKEGVLIEYRGQCDTIIVPRGVRIIGLEDKRIWNKTIHCIYIPNTVWKISDFALPYVESIHCEGTKESLHYDENYNFFAGGWIPDWSANDPVHVHINEIVWHFSDKHYSATESWHYEQYPDELKTKQI